jgi:hypothetical protein
MEISREAKPEAKRKQGFVQRGVVSSLANLDREMERLLGC